MLRQRCRHHSEMMYDVDAIWLENDAGIAQQCTHQHEAVVFPVISSLSRREQMRYTRLLRDIVRAPGAALLGSTARAYSIDTPGSLPGHDTDIVDMADRWLPGLSELTDMALQINMRMGGHTVSRSMSPIHSVTPPAGVSCSGRPQVSQCQQAALTEPGRTYVHGPRRGNNRHRLRDLGRYAGASTHTGAIFGIAECCTCKLYPAVTDGRARQGSSH